MAGLKNPAAVAAAERPSHYEQAPLDCVSTGASALIRQLRKVVAGMSRIVDRLAAAIARVAGGAA